MLQGRIPHLHLIHPLGHGIVIQLLDLVVVHHLLHHQIGQSPYTSDDEK
jgi:hypothetical protein